MPQLNPEFFTSQVFWLILIFALIYIFVANFFIPRVGKVVDLRDAQIKRDITLSEKIILDYKALEIAASKLVDDARHQGFSIVDDASKLAEAKINERMGVIDKEIRKNIAYEEEKLSRFRYQMRENIKDIALDLKKEIVIQLMKSLEVNKSKSN